MRFLHNIITLPNFSHFLRYADTFFHLLPNKHAANTHFKSSENGISNHCCY